MDKEQLEVIRRLIGTRLLAQLEDEEKPARASTLNAAISFLKLHPQYIDKIGAIDSTEQMTDALRQTLAKVGPIPTFDPVTETFGEDEEDES